MQEYKKYKEYEENTSNDYKYYNFPISLLNGFLNSPEESQSILKDIRDYADYVKTLEYYVDETDMYYPFTTFPEVYDCYDDGTDDIHHVIQESYANGAYLFNLHIDCKVKVGITKDMLDEFLNDYKEEIEKACLLAHLAIRSIIGKSPYKKITNEYLFSRMNGNAKILGNMDLLHHRLNYYFTHRRQRDNIINDLQENWQLNYFGGNKNIKFRGGFYVSYKLTKPQLIKQHFKRTKVGKKLKSDVETETAIQKAIKEIKEQADKDLNKGINPDVHQWDIIPNKAV